MVGGKGVWTPGGYRFPDITVFKGSNPVRYFEAKFGNARVSSAQSAKDHWILFYDNRDRLTEVRSPLPGAVARFAYNSFDDLISTTDPDQATTQFTYTQAGRIATMRDALSRIWSYTYDQNGFLAEVREPAVNGVVARWGFQNDALGRVRAELSQGTVLKETTYDARDRVASSSLLESNFGGRLPPRRTTTFAYNAFDQITSVTDPLGRVTRLFYDQFQRPERTQRPDGTSVGRSYNAQGEVA